MGALLSDLKKVPVIRSLLPFIFGILLANVTEWSDYKTVVRLISMNAFLLLVLLISEKGKLLFHLWQVSILHLGYFMLFLSAGVLTMELKKHRNAPPMINTEQNIIACAYLLQSIEEKAATYALEVKLSTILEEGEVRSISTKAILYVDKEIDCSNYLPGDPVLFSGRLKAIQQLGDPEEFDYRSYMHRKGFYHTCYIDKAEKLGKASVLEYRKAYFPRRFRQILLSHWDLEKRNIRILSALTLGSKNLLDSETKKDFSYAGAMHLLAVSGLHVGMIWWVLSSMLRLPGTKKGQILKLVLILLFLWLYAAVTGFSSSVTRSVSMFSILSLSDALQRKSNIYNSLLLSALLLLAINPFKLFEAGFQLSYLAVLSIVSVQPSFYLLYKNSNSFLRKIFDILSVSLSAQVLTLPLSLHLFGQFPVYFLLTNLLAIPLVSLVLGTFILCFPLLLMEWSRELVLELLGGIVTIMDLGITSISSLPGAVISQVSIDKCATLILLLLFSCLIAFIHYRRALYLLLVLLFASSMFIYSALGQLL